MRTRPARLDAVRGCSGGCQGWLLGGEFRDDIRDFRRGLFEQCGLMRSRFQEVLCAVSMFWPKLFSFILLILK